MNPPYMRPALDESPSVPIRILATGGIVGLLALTCADPGATRMWSTPWTLVLAAVLTFPAFGLITRALVASRSFHLPSIGWLLLAAGTAAVPVASSLASAWRAPSLWIAAIAMAAATLFLSLHDWLATAPERNRLLFKRMLAAGFAFVAVVSFVLWFTDVAVASDNHPLATALTVWRNPHPLGHSNYTAGLMLLGLPWLVLAAWREHGWRRGAAFAGAGFAFANLFTSGSRGGLVGLAVLGATALVAARLPWRRLILGGFAAVIAVGLLAVVNPRIRDLLRAPDPLAAPNVSNVQRSAMLHAGWLMGSDRPLFGWGSGMVPLAYPRYRAQLEGGADSVLQLHNTPMQLWAENGAAGVLVALGGLILVLKHRRRDPVAAMALLGYGAFSLTDYQLDVPIFAAAVAACAALLAGPSVAPASAAPRRAVAGAVGALATIVALLGGRDPTPALNVEALALARDPAQHDHAVTLLQQSLALSPDQEIAHFNLGWLLLVSDPAAAEKHFIAAAHLVPDKGGVYFGLGLARLNQARTDDAARAFALECLNEPLFLVSPWWRVPEIAAVRGPTREYFVRALASSDGPLSCPFTTWRTHQLDFLLSLAPRLGFPSAGPEKIYRRERIGYPVLMRNLDLPVPTDLYDVREDPRFPDSLQGALPSKGWLPSPFLLKLLDAPAR